jgi:hypothetical protein
MFEYKYKLCTAFIVFKKKKKAKRSSMIILFFLFLISKIIVLYYILCILYGLFEKRIFTSDMIQHYFYLLLILKLNT